MNYFHIYFATFMVLNRNKLDTWNEADIIIPPFFIESFIFLI